MKLTNNMNRDELRAEAKTHNIVGRGSMNVAELREAVKLARLNVDFEGVTTETEISVSPQEEAKILGTVPPTVEEQAVDWSGWIEAGYIDENPVVAQFELEPRHISDIRSRMTAGVQRKHRKGRPERGRIGRGTTNTQPMGTHYRGRAMGAKHYALIDNAVKSAPKAPRSYPDRAYGAQPMLNTQRVQNYARQQQYNNPDPITHGCPKLTPRQMRRVTKNWRPNGDLIVREIDQPMYGGPAYNLLVRTPQGYGIFYRHVES